MFKNLFNQNFLQRLHPHWPLLFLICGWIGSFALTHFRPGSPVMSEVHSRIHFSGADKIYHFTVYFGLAFLIITVLRRKFAPLPWILLGLACLVLYGFVDEATQPMFGRRFEWSDMIANYCGIGSAVLFFLARTRTLTRRVPVKLK